MNSECEHDSYTVEYEDRLVRVSTCARCGVRVGEVLVDCLWPVSWLWEHYAKWRISQVYGEHIEWHRL